MIQTVKNHVRKPSSPFGSSRVIDRLHAKHVFLFGAAVPYRLIYYSYGNFLKKPIVAKGLTLDRADVPLGM